MGSTSSSSHATPSPPTFLSTFERIHKQLKGGSAVDGHAENFIASIPMEGLSSDTAPRCVVSEATGLLKRARAIQDDKANSRAKHTSNII